MAKFLMQERVLEGDKQTARLGAGSGAANHLSDKEIGKCVKLAGDSRYNLCAVGDAIEGFIVAVEAATLDDYTIGTVQVGGRKEVVADGAQATPGTGNIAVGDYVVAGTMAAKGTALADESSQKVCKATDQAAAKAAPHRWRVVSLGSVGTGAPGTKIVIEAV